MGTQRHPDTTGVGTYRCPQAPVWPPRVPPGRVPVPVSLPSLRNRHHRRVTENKEPFERQPRRVFQATKKLVLSEREGRERALEFLRKNAANGLSVANLLAGLSSILCSVNRQYQLSCWLLLLGFLLDLADGAVARQLNACSALGAKLDDFADFTTFGLGTALLLQPQGVLGGLLALAYVLAVFARLCFFSSGRKGEAGFDPKPLESRRLPEGVGGGRKRRSDLELEKHLGSPGRIQQL
ncbi:PREDICTED: uncharacterized protein LOC108510169 [Lepidothrix coronata]|uniref:cardiolipin synthase (CMP-forming) n=1 Tax=Lepidothrix coronata TaxID=321398 RepID=A0A6J0JB16_9PASS|nr:PREDICTED: uncharacterized protein LOC108510169 [Lepidothrix coronata]